MRQVCSSLQIRSHNLVAALSTSAYFEHLLAVTVARQSGLSQPKGAGRVKWRMAPLLSGDQLLHTDPKEAACDPFKRVVTEDLIHLISAALESLPDSIGSKKKGKKITLIRDTSIALLMYLGGERDAAAGSNAWDLLCDKHTYMLFNCLQPTKRRSSVSASTEVLSLESLTSSSQLRSRPLHAWQASHAALLAQTSSGSIT